MKGVSTSGSTLAFGQYGLKAMEPSWISARQIEAARRVMTRYARRGGRIWIRIFPDKPITARAAETRMGKGKGSPEYWVAVIKPGRILFEIDGLDFNESQEALRKCSNKLPLKTKMVSRREL